jgi:hypothetical protein
MTENAYKPTGTEVLLAVALVPIQTLWSGWVGMHLWGWFAVPLGAPVVTVMQAVGLGLVLSWMAGKNIWTDSNTRTREAWWGVLVVRPLIGPLFWLIIAFAVSRFL